MNKAIRRLVGGFSAIGFLAFSAMAVAAPVELQNPILLDVVDGIPWLVLIADNVYSNVELYGCPEMPYVFLKFDADRSRWIPVASNDAPAVLREANLSYEWNDFYMKKKQIQTPSDIVSNYHVYELETDNIFSRSIPRTYAQWNYKGKKSFATSRVANDCRPPLEQPVDVIFPKGQVLPSSSVQLEILDRKEFNPDWVIIEDHNATESQWDKYAWDAERDKACDAFISILNGGIPTSPARIAISTAL